MLFRDADGRVLILEPNYREGWALPGGTIESDDGETPRNAARRETVEEIGLDVSPGPLLAIDWVSGPGRPPIASYLYDGGVLTQDQLDAIVLQDEELDSWRLVPAAELDAYGPPWLVLRVRAALAALEAGAGPAELVQGEPAR
ncbi:NUDIX domain-containing protein [Streptomyces luteolus]|uniref:NUDIX hydrolase n=1 Tax=Streptomyces luteolus TaxID=3043615 RepID=A0ABT6SPY6_9ACTN|nr:NUDIX hydrolase [Streptomyces sp. B-S-A12]MDI3417410.1 NUDIX hydrolase [Streptomyces sp. B-S-A12]